MGTCTIVLRGEDGREVKFNFLTAAPATLYPLDGEFTGEQLKETFYKGVQICAEELMLKYSKGFVAGAVEAIILKNMDSLDALERGGKFKVESVEEKRVGACDTAASRTGPS